MDLIQRWQSGDSDAFEALFNYYKNMVFRTALLMTSNSSQAEDILQEVFVRVYKSKDKFDGDENSFKKWLYRITSNICIDHYRMKSLSFSSLEEMSEQGFEPAEKGSTQSKFEDRDAIGQAMTALDSKHRSVVILRYFHELPYEEIAQVLDVPLGTVKSRLNKAIKILRNELKKERG